MYLLSQTAHLQASPACHSISNHYGLGAGKSPELGTVTTHWFPIPPRQLPGSSSPSPEPSFRKGKTSSGGCCNNRNLQGEQLLQAEPGPLNDDLKYHSCLPPVFPHLLLSCDALPPPEGVPTFPSANSSSASPPSWKARSSPGKDACNAPPKQTQIGGELHGSSCFLQVMHPCSDPLGTHCLDSFPTQVLRALSVLLTFRCPDKISIS